MQLQDFLADLVERITNQKRLADLNVLLSVQTSRADKFEALYKQTTQDDQATAQKIADLTQEVAELKKQLSGVYIEPMLDTPPYLNTGVRPYAPAIAVPDSDSSVLVDDPTAVYLPTDRDRMEVSPLLGLSKVEKLKRIWADIINPANLKYAFDQRDNWQTPYETRFRKQGDCEDGTIWFIAKCRAARIPATDVFNAVGPTSFGYHSYPVVWLSAEEAKEYGVESEGWYIFESTLDFMPQKPIALKGSQYWVDNGLANWRFAGQLRPEFLGEFNGAKPPAVPAGGVILNGEEKIRQLRQHWKKVSA